MTHRVGNGIVVAVEGTAVGQGALEWAVRQAELRGAVLTVVRAGEDTAARGYRPNDGARGEDGLGLPARCSNHVRRAGRRGLTGDRLPQRQGPCGKNSGRAFPAGRTAGDRAEPPQRSGRHLAALRFGGVRSPGGLPGRHHPEPAGRRACSEGEPPASEPWIWALRRRSPSGVGGRLAVRAVLVQRDDLGWALPVQAVFGAAGCWRHHARLLPAGRAPGHDRPATAVDVPVDADSCRRRDGSGRARGR